MEPKLFDIHSHINFPQFDEDREEVIKKMKEESIWSIVVGTDKETSISAIELVEKHNNLFATVGLHPASAEGGPASGWDLGFYKKLAENPKVVAIGECGLDFFRIKDESLKDKQFEIFKNQIELAIEIDKPLMIHCRDAHNEVLEILNLYKSKKLRGNIHFFSGNREVAQKYFDLGFTISFAGVITFTNAYDEVIKNSPLDKIMIETDAPFVAPVPHRGKRNSPLYVTEIVKKIAQIKNISYEEVVKQTTKNALKLFNIK